MSWPEWIDELRAAGLSEEQAEKTVQKMLGHHPAWQEMSFPGFLGNVIAGRVANRMDLGGSNYIVDAACASSLAAMSAALNELYLGQCDVAITGGVDLLSDIGSYVAFSKTMALSRTGDCRPFSKNADGTIIGEGVVMFALRRLADAERDGDQIYAVIRGHGTSSDGRGSAIYAPRKEGQLRAMRRAYEAAGYSPATVGLVEAHGTGTPLGDATEVASMNEIFAAPDRQFPCALGSIKSQIGHAKTAAGSASLFKVVTALNHKFFPSTIKVDEPNPALLDERSPFYLSTAVRPWISGADHPRRASLSAFGFGGTNAHMTVEEYNGPENAAARRVRFPSQLFLASAKTLDDVLADMADIYARAEKGAAFDGLAHQSQQKFSTSGAHRLAIVATNVRDLKTKLEKASALLTRMKTLPEAGVDGIFYSSAPAIEGKVAFMFPGQGSQYVGMTSGLAVHFDAARAPWDEDDKRAHKAGVTALHQVVFPTPVLSDQVRNDQEIKLRSTDMAQPGLALASLSYLNLLELLGLEPDMTVGHSFGEVLALHAAGAFDAARAVEIARKRGALMSATAEGKRVAMTAVTLDRAAVEAAIARAGANVSIANHNAPRQVVISGLEAEVQKVEQALASDSCKRLPVSNAFHSPIVSVCAEQFRAYLNEAWQGVPSLPVYANVTAAPYGNDIAQCRDTLASQIASTVRFVDSVSAMYDAGARIFVEVGAGSVLKRLTGQCLEGKPHAAIALDGTRQDSIAGFFNAIGQLCVLGVDLSLQALWEGRRIGSPEVPAPLKKHVVWIDSTMKRINEGERLAALARPPVSTAAAHADVSGTQLRPGANTTPSNSSVPTGTKNENTVASTEKLMPAREDLNGKTALSNGLHDTVVPPVKTNGAAKPGNGHAQSVVPTVITRSSAPTPTASEPRDISVQVSAPAMESKIDLRRFELAHQHAAAAHSGYLATIADSHQAFLNFMRDAFRAAEALSPSGVHAAETAYAQFDAGVPAQTAQTPMSAPPAAIARQPSNDFVSPAIEERPPEVIAVRAEAPAKPAVAQSPASPAEPPAEEKVDISRATQVISAVLGIIAEKTGYPEDMLDDALELEGDLGIDSIKRVEIFMALRERIPFMPAPTEADAAKVGQLKSIADVIDFLQERLARANTKSASATFQAEGAAPKAEAIQSLISQRLGTASAPAAEVVTQMPVAAPKTLASAPVATKPAAPSVDFARLTLEIIAEKTGYPIDMLENEMELEADLGVDSIRRVEIFMALRDRAPDLPAPSEADQVRAGQLKTIGDVIGYLNEKTADAPAAPVSKVIGLGNPSQTPAAPVDRLIVTLAAAPAQGQAMAKLSKDQPIAIVSDELGVAKMLGDKLTALGFAVRFDEVAPDTGSVIFLGGLARSANAERSLEIHRHAFLSAKSAVRLAEEGGAFITVQDTGGGFGLDADAGERAWLGGLASISKTVAKCWPKVDAKAIDIECAGRDPQTIASAILDELFKGGPEMEVALTASGLRRAPVITRSEFSSQRRGAPAISKRSVILVSGGARGVTAPCLEALARTYQPHIVLLGRTPLEHEPPGLEHASTEQEIKGALLAAARAAGETPAPAQIGRRASAILSARSARACLARLEELGSPAKYLALDIRDKTALAAGLDEVRAVWGPITGLIHAAGVLMDKKIADKTEEQFDLIFGTKVLGLGNLLDTTRQDPLEMICLFSSVSAQFGNVGQIDYSAANAVLNQVALAESHRRKGCLVRSINWGAWEGGMITPSLARFLTAASISLISYEAGAAFCQRELSSADDLSVEVLALDGENLLPFAGAPERRTRLFELERSLVRAAE